MQMKKLMHQKLIKEKPSSDYSFYSTQECHNPITDQKEPYFPLYLAKLRRIVGFLILLTFIGITVAAHVLVIVSRIFIHHFMFLSDEMRFIIRF